MYSILMVNSEPWFWSKLNVILVWLLLLTRNIIETLQYPAVGEVKDKVKI